MEAATEERINLEVVYHSNQNRLFFESKAKVKVIAKGRRFGLTKGYANFIIERMLDGISPILWVDTVLGNIDRYVERYIMPVLSKLPSQYWKWRQQKKELQIFESRLDMRSADRPELIEGFAYRLIVLNEAGIILKDEYLWENTIRPMTLDFDPDILIGGTPKGQNLFHDLKVKAQDDKDPRYKDWEFFHFTSYDNPYIDAKVIQDLEADLPDHVRRQEIFAEFLEDSASVFRNVDNCMSPHSTKQGKQEGKTYYIGLDLAKHVDFTVLTILDGDGNQVYHMRLNKLDWPYQKRLIIDLVRSYGGRLIMDSSGIGDPIYDDIVNEGLDVVGYKFTNESKKKLIECLMISIEQEKIRLLDEPIQTNEMKIFGYEISPSGVMKYSAPQGKHDDCVIALALANWGRENSGGRDIIVF
jgi:hypothetical protein